VPKDSGTDAGQPFAVLVFIIRGLPGGAA